MNGLRGKRIVVTRAPHQAGELAALLEARGAIPLLYPCIDIAPPDDTLALDAALCDATNGAFDWLVLTSVNTVLALANRLRALQLNSARWTLNVAAVGSATAESVERLLGLHVATIPDDFTGEALASAVPVAHNTRVFLPHSAVADPELADLLEAAGAIVTTVDAYRTIVGSGGVDLPLLLARREVDAITLTSASTAINLVTRLEADVLLQHTMVACIGSRTADAARRVGLRVDVVPVVHTIVGLVNALEVAFTR